MLIKLPVPPECELRIFWWSCEPVVGGADTRLDLRQGKGIVSYEILVSARMPAYLITSCTAGVGLGGATPGQIKRCERL